MNLRSVLPVALMAAAFVSPAFAQSASSEDEESNLTLTLPTDEWYVPKNTITFGYRVLGKGIQAKFGNLGSVASIRTIVPASQGDAARQYDNGSVTKDQPRANEYEFNADGTVKGVKTTPGTRYQIYRTNDDGSQTLTLDYLAYTPGQTREYSYQRESQASNGVLALSNYSARGQGASASKDEGVNGGVELSLSRAMGKLGKRFDWSLTAGLALNGMNARTAGTVTSTLITYTDYYTLNGAAPVRSSTGTLGGPTFVDALEANGTTVANTNGIETTTTLSGAPTGTSTTIETPGGATVQGNWKIKGAYFLMRVGPSIRTQVTDRFGVSASLGLAGAFAGSRYSVVERLQIENVTDPIMEEKDSAESKFLTGYYADMTVDWAANERTGLFAGVNMQHLSGYDQEVAGRTAKIDIGSAVGIHGGISIKF
jgi:hypothetical protein